MTDKEELLYRDQLIEAMFLVVEKFSANLSPAQVSFEVIAMGAMLTFTHAPDPKTGAELVKEAMKLGLEYAKEYTKLMSEIIKKEEGE